MVHEQVHTAKIKGCRLTHQLLILFTPTIIDLLIMDLQRLQLDLSDPLTILGRYLN